jgi:hypothetical protein
LTADVSKATHEKALEFDREGAVGYLQEREGLGADPRPLYFYLSGVREFV